MDKFNTSGLLAYGITVFLSALAVGYACKFKELRHVMYVIASAWLFVPISQLLVSEEYVSPSILWIMMSAICAWVCYQIYAATRTKESAFFAFTYLLMTGITVLAFAAQSLWMDMPKREFITTYSMNVICNWQVGALVVFAWLRRRG